MPFFEELISICLSYVEQCAVEVRMREDVIEKSREVFIRKGSKKRSPESV